MFTPNWMRSRGVQRLLRSDARRLAGLSRIWTVREIPVVTETAVLVLVADTVGEEKVVGAGMATDQVPH